MLIFDIETGPLTDDQLRKTYKPPELPKPLGEFDAKTVKLGRMVDEAKIKAKVDAARTEHATQKQQYFSNCQKLEQNAWHDYQDKAALNPVTGKVICIGYSNADASKIKIDDGGKGGEKAILETFWRKCEQCREDDRRSLVGLNILDFDLPFLKRRSWFHDIKVPKWVQPKRYFDDQFVDLRVIWLCGQHPANVKSNFTTLAAFFGTPGKPPETDGGLFAQMWVEDRPRAIAYLEGDLQQPAIWAARMGVV